MKTISKILMLLTAVFALTACIDADHPTPQQGSKGADQKTSK